MGLELNGNHCPHKQGKIIERIVKVLADDQYDLVTRKEQAKAAGIADRTLAKYLKEFPEIYEEALAIRRRAYAKYSPEVDQALLRACKNGNPAALKLWYERHEKWAAHLKVEQSGESTVRHIVDVPPRPDNYDEWVKNRLSEVLS